MSKGISISVVACLMVAACTTTSDVVPMGKDSYMVSVDTRGGAGGGAAKAAQAANRYCEVKGLHMIVRRTDRSGRQFGSAPATDAIIFSCVSADDPEYQRPNLHKDPGVVIQDQR